MILNLKKPLVFVVIAFFITIAVAAMLNTGAVPSFSGIGDYTIVLDAGHGAPDGGAVGANGTEEKDINLAITLRLREILESRGMRVIMTRTDDNSICDSSAETLHEMKVSDMHNRLSIINGSGADLFLSIHMNSFPDPSLSGLHIFYSRNHPEAQTVAELIQSRISELTGAKTHTVKTASETLYLMKNPAPPAVLVECGFISNPDEEKLLNDDKYRSKIAFAIANANSGGTALPICLYWSVLVPKNT